jgi:nucleoside-diphosphate-sugar epimerase
MMSKSIDFAAVLAVLLSGSASAFAPSNRSSHAASAAVRGETSLSMSAALIVQNKGGGHGELGFQLAKTLQNNSKITSITILQDEACNDDKEPFASYSTDIPDVNIIKANLADDSMTADSLQSILGETSYEYVWDNASKKPEGAGKAICDCAKSWNTKLFTYVSSAGMYQPTKDTVYPMAETTPIKESAGQNQFDNYAVEIGLPLVSIRPQYIYGPKASKYDYIDWYFDRLVRELPLPIPGDGTQKVSLTNSEDVASLLASVLNNEEAAVEQRFFNCGTDQLVSYDEVAKLCAKAAGVDEDKIMIEHYDAEKYGKAKFPFRMTDFYVAPDMAKEKLGWEGPTHSLGDDLAWYYDGYKARGGASKKIDFMKDWEITVGSKTSYEVGSIYDKWDPLVIDTSNVKSLKIEE